MECKKVKFADEKSIQFYIKKLRDTSVRIKKPVAGYLCSHCLCWHLTSRTQKDDIQMEKYRATIKNQKELIEQLQSSIRKWTNKYNEIKNKN